MMLDRDSFEAQINDRTRAVVICTPSNPGGLVLSRDDLEWIGELAQTHDLLVFSDEIYEYITYDGLKHVSAASIPALRNRTLLLGGYSKTFSITGWRIGYLAAPADIMDKAAVASDLLYICAPNPLQRGVLKGLEAPTTYYEEMRQHYETGRGMICDALEAGGFKAYRPKGSYYVMADFSALGWADDQQACMELLRRTKVAAIPGGAFFEPGSGRGSKLLRFCYAKELDVLEEACNRLRSLRD
jgi:aminotransferase